MQWLAVAVGGAIGALARYAVVAYAFPVAPNRFPFGTLLVNVIGSLLIGLCYVAIIEKGWLGPQWRLFAMTGLLGAFTTFSAFALEAVHLWHYGNPVLALAYVVVSVLACIAAAAIGLALMGRILV